jgi:hypothetical protein
MLEDLLLYGKNIGYDNESIKAVRNHVRLLLYWSVISNARRPGDLSRDQIRNMQKIIWESKHDFFTRSILFISPGLSLMHLISLEKDLN